MTNPLVLLTGGEPGEPESAGSDLDAFPDRFLDRELSWLRFNRRVLELAEGTAARSGDRLGHAA